MSLKLSEKQREVLELLAEGESRKLVALRLGILVKTLNSRMETARKNNGLKGRWSAIVLLIKYLQEKS